MVINMYVTYLKIPREAWKTPANKVAKKTNSTYCLGFSVGLTTLPSIDDIRSDATATVPTAKSFELPNMAYISGGTKLESAYLSFQIYDFTFSTR